MNRVRAGERGSLMGLVCLSLGLAAGLAMAETPTTNAVSPMRVSRPYKPNIILILADDLGYGELGCYGQSRIKTPNLDELAKDSLRFRDFYAGSSIGAPSRYALMTGLHTGHAAIRGSGDFPLGPDELTVAKLLQESGYATGLVGKWGLGDSGSTGMPQQQGFKEFVGYLTAVQAHDYYPDRLFRYDPLHPQYPTTTISENWGGKHGYYADDLLTMAAVSYLQNHQPRYATTYQPFFLYLAYTIPHANNEEASRSGNGMQVPSDAPYSSELWPQAEKNKAAMITRLDRDVGKLMQKLKDLRIENNTLVMFTSDNGPHKEGGVDPKFFQSAGPLRGSKRDLYEGGIRVPFIAHWPGKIKPGVSELPVAFWDVMPTAAEIAGTNAPATVDGISFLPTLLGQTQTNQHAFFYWECYERGFQQAVRMGEWKAVRPGVGKPLELYNLKTDLGEKKNVAEDNPKVVGQIEEYLKTARTDSGQWPVPAAKTAAR